MDTLSVSSSGCWLARTRTLPVSQCPLAQGPFPPGGGAIGQSATSHIPGIGTTGMPLTSTRGSTRCGIATPWWVQATLAPTKYVIRG